MKILLIEDDPVVSYALIVALELEHFILNHVTSIQAARETLAKNQFQLILMDVNLPDGKGYRYCQELRQDKNMVPIIMITANADEETAIRSLDGGANDYVRKPFSVKELVLRIRLRMNHGFQQNVIVVDNLEIDLDKRLIRCEEGTIELARKEFDLFVTFVKRLEHVLSREHIIEILDSGTEINDRTIDSHISHLRSKFKKCHCHHFKIKSMYGVGYKLVIEKT